MLKTTDTHIIRNVYIYHRWRKVGTVSSLILFCILTLVGHSGAVSQARQGYSDYATNCSRPVESVTILQHFKVICQRCACAENNEPWDEAATHKGFA